jgi:hypothetical protein
MWQDHSMDTGDAFGEAFPDYEARGDGAHIVERDDGVRYIARLTTASPRQG